MRKYYLFIIKNDVYASYYSNSEILYKTLENLFNMKCGDISYGISIYHQICQTFNVDVLHSYFHSRRNFFVKKKGKKILVHNRDDNERYLIEIRSSCIIIYCKYNLPKILKLLNYYNPKIFVCDFYNRDYFWNNKSYSNIYSKMLYNVI